MTTATDTITDQDIAAIRATRDPWIQMCLGRNWDGLLSLCTSDIAFLPPDEPIAAGQADARAFLEVFPVMTAFTFEFTHIEGRGDHASARGTFSINAEVEGNEVTMNGKFVDTFRKEGDAWRYREVIWNTDHPM